ncbi:glycosyltransferase family 4 protein [Streptomyces sp. ISL-94]|uniref:glycosyltransferase family 4 protein n=1 Tax=Streptomyces sp. ISL-94 TaxID=2819190 RepID=UPI001BEBEC2A|nr:glycosyltransferase family 4 protein [Streptomyces sp. ISL-94]MBT2478899.1 glycosyltransferase family 4 protein [Streptomyces sp. ISL-94]
MNRTLDIAMVATPWFELPPTAYGGIESMCADLIDGLVELGHKVTVIGVGANGTKGDFIATDPAPQGEKRLGRTGPEVLHAARVGQVLRTLRPDIVHDHSSAGPLQAGQRPVPTVVTAHGPVSGENGDYYRALADSVSLVAISRAQQHQAPELPWAGQVHNAVRTLDHPFRERKGERVLFLGRIAADKGVHLAIDAAREAGRAITIAGRCNDPDEEPYFEREVVPRLGEDAQWVGEVDLRAKRELLAEAHCLIFPICWEEPFGMVMIEAMACGTPVVALRRGSVPEIVEHGVTGFVCERPEELADAIRTVGRLAPRDCRARVLDRFDTSRMAEAYASLYHLLARRTDPW